MKKTLAILATVAAVGATAVTAPAEARGIGPGLAFGLAAGAIAAGIPARNISSGLVGASRPPSPKPEASS